MGSSAEWRCRHSLRRFADLHQSVSSVSLVSSGLPEGGRIPPGGYPSSFATALASFYARHHIVFSCTRRICDFRLVQGRSSLGPDRELFPFELSHSALSHQFTGRQGCALAVASLFPRRGALRKQFPAFLSDRFPCPLPFHRFTDWWNLP